MKKLILAVLICTLTASAFAAEVITKGGKPVAYHKRGKFYADKAMTQLVYDGQGNTFYANGKALFSKRGERLNKGTSWSKDDAVVSMVELGTKSGDVIHAKIYDGYCIFRDFEKKYVKGNPVVLSYRVSNDGSTIIKGKILYTFKNNKVYKGDSTADKDLIFTISGGYLNSANLLFAIYTYGK